MMNEIKKHQKNNNQKNYLHNGFQLKTTMNFVDNYRSFRELRKKILPFLDCNNIIWTIVYQIYEAEVQGETLYISNISCISNIPQTTVIRHLNKLSEGGFIWKVRNDNDKRMVKIRLSPKFKTQIDELFIRTEILDGAL